MRKSMKPVGILLAVAVILAVAIGAWFLLGPGGRPATPIPPPEKPAMVDAYDRLLAAHKAKQAGQPVDINLEPFPEDTLDIIAGYERLFTHVKEALSAAGIDDMQESLYKEPYEWTNGEKSVIADFLAANQDVIREIRETVLRGGPVYPLDFSKGRLDLDLPHHAMPAIRNFAVLLGADAVMNGMKGNYATAVEDVIAGMRFGDAFALEPRIVSQYMRMLIYGLMSSAVQNAFSGADLPPELTERLVSHLAQADHREALVEALRAELYAGEMDFWAMKRGDGEWFSDKTADQSTGMDALMERLSWRLSGLGWRLRREQEESFRGIINRWIAAAKLPYYEAAPELELMKKEIDNLGEYSILLMLFLHPRPSDPCEAQARYEAALDLVQLGILVEQYKAQNGSYPETLDAIAPDLGGSVPVDPFSGVGYHYQAQEDDFILYSVGQNLVDDGGKPDWREGDIVWRGEQKKADEAAQVGGE